MKTFSAFALLKALADDSFMLRSLGFRFINPKSGCRTESAKLCSGSDAQAWPTERVPKLAHSGQRGLQRVFRGQTLASWAPKSLAVRRDSTVLCPRHSGTIGACFLTLDFVHSNVGQTGKELVQTKPNQQTLLAASCNNRLLGVACCPEAESGQKALGERIADAVMRALCCWLT